MLRTGLTFDPVEHKYFLDGLPIPGVTEIIEQQLCPVYEKDSDIMKRAAAFGTAVHSACEFYDKRTLDHASLAPAIIPYLNGWIKFRAERPGEIICNESLVCSYKYRYGGKLDRIIDFGKGPELVDLKTSTAFSSAVGPQTAAYAQAAEEHLGIKCKRRLCIKLHENGYGLGLLTDRNDLSIFISALSCKNWRGKHGK